MSSQLPWFRRLVVFLQLHANSRGDISFTKAMSIAVLAIKPPAVIGIGVLAAAFGKSVFSSFIEKSQFSASVSETISKSEQKVSHEIYQRRDPEEGIEETK